jgi:hypothetical protein
MPKECLYKAEFSCHESKKFVSISNLALKLNNATDSIFLSHLLSPFNLIIYN